MYQGLPSKNIVPNASLDTDINSYTYLSGSTIVPVDKAKFIKICENASVFPEGTYSVYAYPSGTSQSSSRGWSPRISGRKLLAALTYFLGK